MVVKMKTERTVEQIILRNCVLEFIIIYIIIYIIIKLFFDLPNSTVQLFVRSLNDMTV